MGTGINPASSIRDLPGVRPRQADKLAKLGLHRIGDLLLHLPRDYEDRTRVTPIAATAEGHQAVVVGEITDCDVSPGGRRFSVQITDHSGSMTLVFFRFHPNQAAKLIPGVKLWCFGSIQNRPSGLEMVHPEYQVLGEQAPIAVDDHLTPIYPATEGLTQATLRRLIQQAFAVCSDLPELLPADNLPSCCPLKFTHALQEVHRPGPQTDRTWLQEKRSPAWQRLAFEELLAHQLSLLTLRQQTKQQPAPVLTGSGRLAKRLCASLPFQLTGAQRRVLDEIVKDLSQPHPMLRLLQGDVGSGKTIVAALACLHCIEAGYQAAIMAPTEILAEQHRENFSNWLKPLEIPMGWITGRLSKTQRQKRWERVSRGEDRLVVGTHALFQGEAEFPMLGLVVIDEQHRFGVHQRLALRQKGEQRGLRPHQLIMTATPIPRTLAMTAYTDLDLSVIDELPPGRKPIATAAIADSRRNEVIERIAVACASGRQAYWICTLIETSDTLQAQAAEATYATLQTALPELTVGLVHGRQRAVDKNDTMARFKAGGVDLLVATTVIEVGVDVPNASLMIIENAERLGLSQLHQLRGRVGRGTQTSSCVLLYKAPLSESGWQRLQAMREHQSGFELAEIDLALRGPGELLGTRQTGAMGFRVAEITRHQALLPAVKQAAHSLANNHPNQIEPLLSRWLNQNLAYGQV